MAEISRGDTGEVGWFPIYTLHVARWDGSFKTPVASTSTVGRR